MPRAASAAVEKGKKVSREQPEKQAVQGARNSEKQPENSKKLTGQDK